MNDREDFRLLLGARRRQAADKLRDARACEKADVAEAQTGKIQNYDKVAEENGWRYCEKCGSYEGYDDDKCRRCGAPLFKYSARGEGVV